MKISDKKIKQIIRASLISEGIIDTSVDFLKSLFKDEKTEKINKTAEEWIESYMDRLNGIDLEIAKKNYDKLKKDKKLFKTIFYVEGGGVGIAGEDSADAKVMSYLLLGHPDFKGMNQAQIEKKLSNLIKNKLKHHVSSKTESQSSEKLKTMGDNITNQENKSVFDSVSKQVNMITGGEVYQSLGQYSHKLGGTELLVSYSSIKYKNLPEYKYGSVEKEGKGLSALFSVIKFQIGNLNMEFMHYKNIENLFKSEKEKDSAGGKNGLHINGSHFYGYDGPYSNGFQYIDSYDNAVQRLSSRIGSLKSKYPKADIVNGLLKNYLAKLEFDIDFFKRKLNRNRREAILISGDGSKIVGTENVDNYLSKNVKIEPYKKI